MSHYCYLYDTTCIITKTANGGSIYDCLVLKILCFIATFGGSRWLTATPSASLDAPSPSWL